MLESLDERTRRLNVIDIGLIKLAVFFVAIIVVKLLPQLTMLDSRLLIIFVLLFSLRPIYRFWHKGKSK
jgi:hypothetical protein